MGRPTAVLIGLAGLVGLVAVLAGLWLAAEDAEHVKSHGEPSSKKADAFMVAAYVPSYRLEHVVAHMESGVAPFVSDLVFFSASVGAGAVGEALLSLPFASADLHAAVRAARSNQVARVHLCIGGGGAASAGFAQVARSGPQRARFAEEALALVRTFGFDGVNVDWEGPSGPAQAAHYTLLLRTLKGALSPHDKLLSVALHHWQDQHDADADLYFVMAYDLARVAHATLKDTKLVVDGMVAKGHRADKVVVGIPAYGRGPDSVQTYAEILQGGEAQEGGEAPRADMWFNGPAAVREKTRWAKADARLAGVFFWEAGQDALATPHKSLLAAAAAAAKEA